MTENEKPLEEQRRKLLGIKRDLVSKEIVDLKSYAMLRRVEKEVNRLMEIKS